MQYITVHCHSVLMLCACSVDIFVAYFDPWLNCSMCWCVVHVELLKKNKKNGWCCYLEGGVQMSNMTVWMYGSAESKPKQQGCVGRITQPACLLPDQESFLWLPVLEHAVWLEEGIWSCLYGGTGCMLSASCPAGPSLPPAMTALSTPVVKLPALQCCSSADS